MHQPNPHIRTILLLALILRLALPIASYLLNGNTQRFFQPDTATYLLPAQEWLASGHYAVQNIPELLRPPGYPLFLIPGIIFGLIAPLTILLQVILSLFTVYIITQIAYHITNNHRVERLVGLLAAIEPLSIIYTSQLLTETLFTTLLITALYTLMHARYSPKMLIIAALLFAGATYVRPMGYYLPVVLLIPLIYTRYPKKQIALFFFICLGLPGLWQIRNHVMANYPGFSAISSVNLYFYQSAAVKAKIENMSFSEKQIQLGYRDSSMYFAYHPNQRTWSYAQQHDYMTKEGLMTLIKYPVVYTTIHIKGMIRTLFDPGAIDLLKLLNAYPKRGGLLGQIVDQGLHTALVRLIRELPGVSISNIILGFMLLGYYILASFSFKQIIRIQFSSLIFCLITCFYFVILSGGPQSLNRFRQPIMPIVSIFAGIGLTRLSRRYLLHPTSPKSPKMSHE